MENGYLGGIVLTGTILLLSLAYAQFRKPDAPAFLDNETAATIAAYLVTAALAFGVTIFASNAYLTDTFSTIVSSSLVVGAIVFLGITIARTRTASAAPMIEPYTPAPFTPETPPANVNKPSSGRGKSRRKAA